MWSSGWVRTLFFNSTQPDEQNPKPSPRVRTSELAQGSGSDRIACSVQPVEQNLMANPRVDLSTRAFGMSRNWGWALDEQIGLFDSTRRTRTRTRPILPDKNPNPSNPPGQKGCAQPCPTLGLDARARVQLNPTVILITHRTRFVRQHQSCRSSTKTFHSHSCSIWFNKTFKKLLCSCSIYLHKMFKIKLRSERRRRSVRQLSTLSKKASLKLRMWDFSSRMSLSCSTSRSYEQIYRLACDNRRRYDIQKI